MTRLRRPLLLLAFMLLTGVAGLATAAQTEYEVRGMVLSVNRSHRTFTASVEAIPGYAAAKTMPFEVSRPSDLDSLQPGALVTFTLIVNGRVSYAVRVAVVRDHNAAQDPFSASRMALLREMGGGADAVRPIPVGGRVPGFTLTDQRGRPVSLEALRGRVLALNFIYTNCALPTYCLRLASHFAAIQKRFASGLGRDLVLLTVTFDPERDTPPVLEAYAKQWNADADTWRFLTGAPADVDRVCRLFGVHAFANEGLLDHSLHTVVVDREGQVVANIEGNQFTATQLGDLVAGVLARAR